MTALATTVQHQRSVSRRPPFSVPASALRARRRLVTGVVGMAVVVPLTVAMVVGLLATAVWQLFHRVIALLDRWFGRGAVEALGALLIAVAVAVVLLAALRDGILAVADLM